MGLCMSVRGRVRKSERKRERVCMSVCECERTRERRNEESCQVITGAFNSNLC